MVDLSQISTLLGGSAASDKTATTLVGGLLSQNNNDLAAVTEAVLSSKISVQPAEDTVSFSQELQNYITENVKNPAQAEQLLSDIAAIENLNDQAENNADATGQLLGANTGSNANEAGNILDLLA